MADAGTLAADKAQAEMERRLLNIYKQAQREIEDKLKEFTKKHKKKDMQMRADLKTGKISDKEYRDWQQGQAFIGKQWQDKLDSVTETLLNANKHANMIVEGEKRAVFGENATYQAYKIENDLGANLSFSVYDSATVTRIVRDHPELLPRKVVNGQKDKAWNKVKIDTAVAQGIIQGESIDDIAKRIARQTASQDMNAMTRYARTAMTCAQNSGRIEVMREAKDMGINVKKKWLATLDSRTRDSHKNLDGQVQDVDKPFQSDFGKIMFPGDPSAHPADVYNCRCTLIYEYPEYGFKGKRRDNETKEIIQDLTYNQWKEAKTHEKLTDVVKAKETLDEYQNQVLLNGADKVFSGIWKDDVTYADYIEKKESGAIDRKSLYYVQQMDEAELRGDTDSYKKYKKLLNELREFRDKGYENYHLLQDRDKALRNFQKLYDDMSPKKRQFAADAWDAATKQKALAFSDKYQADKYFRAELDRIWDNVPDEGKYSLWEYTHNSHPINKSLSGYHDDWSRSSYIGPDKTDWGHEDAWRTVSVSPFKKYNINGHTSYKNVITDLTKAIDTSTFSENVYLVRGSDNNGLAGMIEAGNVMSYDDALKMLSSSSNEAQVKASLIGKRVKNNAFTSTGIAQGTGFTGTSVQYDIYAPKETHAIYAEPQSYYGATADRDFYKKGQSYSGVNQEAEVLIQRGTEYEITDISWNTGNGCWAVKMDVVKQPDYFTYGDEDTYNDGNTRHKN